MKFIFFKRIFFFLFYLTSSLWFVLISDEDCACRTIRVMINGQEAELTIIDIPYVEMSVSFQFYHSKYYDNNKHNNKN